MEDGSRRTNRTRHNSLRRTARTVQRPCACRAAALVLCMAMCLSLLPAHTLSEGTRYPCGHTCSDGTCSYREARESVPCDHTHNGGCGYALGSACNHTHTHDGACGYDPDTGAACTHVHVHSEACGYAPASPCTHVCGDGTCAYAAAQDAAPCDHVCAVTEFDQYIPGTPIRTVTASSGETAEQIAARLPAALKGRTACAPGRLVDIPVKWTCASYNPATAGTYRFTASLDPAVASYAVPDDPATPKLDESVTSPYCDLPAVEVTVAEGASGSGPLPTPVVPARGHTCEVVRFTDDVPGMVLAVAEFDKGRTVEELYAEVLPQTLAVTLACPCAGAETTLPVTWKCEDFDPNATGDYIFTVAALPEYPFTYLPQDDPATVETDERWRPSILVRVYEPTAPRGKFTVCYGVINAENVHVRSGPGTIYESLAQFSADTPVTVTGQCDHWYRVDIASWKGAFVDKSLITILEELTEAVAPVTGKINAGAVKLRTGPDREYDTRQTLALDTPVTILGRCTNWYYVSLADEETGYVWREYVTVDPPKPVEGPACICTAHCEESAPNPECPVCAEHPGDCAIRLIGEGFPKDGKINLDNCEALVGGATVHLRLDTPVTLYNEADGRYEFSSEQIEKGLIAAVFVDIIEYVCTCTAPCTQAACNQLCPVCAKEGFGACSEKVMTEQAITAEVEDGSTVTVSGSLPAGAAVSVALVPLETAKEFVAEGATILFAYDIKILVGGVEWQPGETVKVAIAPPAPIEAPVAVTHVAEDAETGEKTPQAVMDAVTTEKGEVAFGAEGFSIYIITLTTHQITFAFGSPYTVNYGTTDATPANITNELTASATVDATGPLYFTVSGGLSSVTRDGMAMAADGNGVYTVDNITADTAIAIGGEITFDLSQGPVSFGATYSGKDSTGTVLTGPHQDGNQYTITQSGDITANTISFPETGNYTGNYDLTLDGINISADPSISISAESHAIKVTLRLRNVNTIQRLHYSTGHSSSIGTSDSSLTITSANGDGSPDGVLTAESTGTWAAAIGGTDDQDATLNIFIKGGTIHATGMQSAAIGGGGNGAATITISGGAVTATNSGNGATIGGGGAASQEGGPAEVTITGGTVTATNYGAGVAIGGGGTNESRGAAGTVTISGGFVTANGGSEGIDIGGGGGKTGAGAATVAISGGAVIASGTRGVSGGRQTSNNEYAATNFTLTGGSYSGKVAGGETFTQNGIIYYHTPITFLKDSLPVADAAVSSVNGASVRAMTTNANGLAYIWLPDGTTVTYAVIGSDAYIGSIPAGTTGGSLSADTAFVFYLDKGAVTIGWNGTDYTYSGTTGAGTAVSGPHASTNHYIITQTPGTVTENRINLHGGTGATFAVTIENINNATAENKAGDIYHTDGSITTDGNHHTTLYLSGENTVGRLHHSTSAPSGEPSGAGASLIITSASGDGSLDGTLTVESTAQWSAAIGGTDYNYESAENITINGGTIIAKARSTAAIGGGGNGSANITITGGSVTATNSDTGATIGGGGGRSDNGGSGNVTITGGTVSATNNGTGVSIGAGGSENSNGSNGTVIISGGTVIAGKIGGGSSISKTGGEANITISGGTVTATSIGGGSSTGSTAESIGGNATVAITGGYINTTNQTGNAIGGGNSTSGTGGTATVTISGGTVKTGHIGGGLGADGYANADFEITGGSINCTTSATPHNSNALVYMTRATLYLNGAIAPNQKINSLGIRQLVGSVYGEFEYGTRDMRTDAAGVLYIGLPANTFIYNAVVGSTTYAGDIPANQVGVLVSGAQSFHNIRVSPSDRYALFSDSDFTNSFSGITTIEDIPNTTETFTFYIECDLGNTVEAYVPDPATGRMVKDEASNGLIALPDSDTGSKRYSYTIRDIVSDRVVGLMTHANGTNRLTLDLSMGDVVIQNDTADGHTGYRVSSGQYYCDNYNGEFTSRRTASTVRTA